jgi:hypothetical protein
VTEPPAPFAGLLRELRAEARLRREKLAEAPGLSPRATSDLKRVATPHTKACVSRPTDSVMR